MALDPKKLEKWRLLAGELQRSYVVTEGLAETGIGPIADNERTDMLKAIPELIKELERLQEKERWIDTPGILRETRDQGERLRQEIARLAALVRRSAPKP